IAINCSEIDILVSQLLRKLKRQQDKKSQGNTEEKNFQKRRIVCGAHEALKYAQTGKVRMVIHAKNLDEKNVRASSNFHSLQRICPINEIPLVEAMTKKELSRIVNKFPYVSVIGVINYEGFESEFDEVVREWRSSDSFRNFHIDQSSILP
uniref:Ribosomal_L7Ae domain-containing protein n=1 Tax=Caenorhabditis japonica TaxID=281687 RepID=A0A8R1EVX8_CAEJA